jgi:AAA15 family ATPase/GTPase
MSELAPPAQPSVLLSFRARNVRSFRDGLELSMLATTLSEKDARRAVPWREGGAPVEVLPVAALFGANASGKTNVMRAMDDMRMLVLQSFRSAPTSDLPHMPFRLDEASAHEPTRFEIDIVLEGVRHEYGFEFDRERVISEWAFRHPHGRPALLFERHGDEVEFGPTERAKSRAVRELLRPNALFLSTAAHANHPVLLSLYGWFSRNLLLAEADSRAFRHAFTLQLLEDDEEAHAVLELLRAADLGIVGARKYEFDEESRERLRRAVRILAGEEEAEGTSLEPTVQDLLVLKHRGAAGDVEFNPNEESLGTLVWFGLVGPVIDALARGAVLLADELDASLHPALVAQLVQLFQDEQTNPNRAQLIFNSHAMTLLGDATGDRLIGRDQVWFTEKDNEGVARLFSLTDLDPRKDEAIGKRYLAGRYGAMPILSAAQFRQVAERVTSGDGTT